MSEQQQIIPFEESLYGKVFLKLQKEIVYAALRGDINLIDEAYKYTNDLKKIDRRIGFFPALIGEYNKIVEDEKRRKIFADIVKHTKDGKPGMPQSFYESFPPTNPIIKILMIILIVSVIISSILFVLGLILGFIYAIRAEFREKNKSVLRVIGRTFLGFVFVARYWSMYGFW